MELSEFWQLIEQSRKAGACEEQAEALTNLLSRKPASEIIDFDRLFHERMCEAYRWDLWAVAFIVGGGSSDDGFEYFRSWLIGQGQAYFEAALREPERAADHANPDDEDGAECEELLYAAARAYESVTGQEDMPDDHWQSADPAGERWEEEDLSRLFPALCERFGF